MEFLRLVLIALSPILTLIAGSLTVLCFVWSCTQINDYIHNFLRR